MSPLGGFLHRKEAYTYWAEAVKGNLECEKTFQAVMQGTGDSCWTLQLLGQNAATASLLHGYCGWRTPAPLRIPAYWFLEKSLCKLVQISLNPRILHLEFYTNRPWTLHSRPYTLRQQNVKTVSSQRFDVHSELQSPDKSRAGKLGVEKIGSRSKKSYAE